MKNSNTYITLRSKSTYEVEYDLDKMRFRLLQNDNFLSLHSHYVILI